MVFPFFMGMGLGSAMSSSMESGSSRFVVTKFNNSKEAGEIFNKVAVKLYGENAKYNWVDRGFEYEGNSQKIDIGWHTFKDRFLTFVAIANEDGYPNQIEIATIMAISEEMNK